VADRRDKRALPLEVLGLTPAGGLPTGDARLVSCPTAGLHPWRLSGGMQRRVATPGRSRSTAILLMDEPFSALVR
jgi:ABC-type taurine transport system ATPase subunit